MDKGSFPYQRRHADWLRGALFVGPGVVVKACSVKEYYTKKTAGKPPLQGSATACPALQLPEKADLQGRLSASFLCQATTAADVLSVGEAFVDTDAAMRKEAKSN